MPLPVPPQRPPDPGGSASVVRTRRGRSAFRRQRRSSLSRKTDAQRYSLPQCMIPRVSGCRVPRCIGRHPRSGIVMLPIPVRPHPGRMDRGCGDSHPCSPGAGLLSVALQLTLGGYG